VAEPHRARPYARPIIAGGIFVVALAASRFCVDALSTIVSPDTFGYWSTLPGLLLPVRDYVPLRTPLYAVVFALSYSVGGSVAAVLAVQFAARGLACALVAWSLARERPLAGLVVGAMLALDPIAAGMSTHYLTESLYATGMLLSLVVLVSQLQDSASLTRGKVLGAGIIFGWAFLFRPNGMFMIVPALAAYWIVSRSARLTAWALGGFSAVAVAVAVFNYLRYGMLAVVASGLYLSVPLFVQQLFDAGNGPASAALHARMKACDPELDYRGINVDTVNDYVYNRFLPCLSTGLPAEFTGKFEIYRLAYLEAIRAHPFVFAERMALESVRFLGSPAASYVAGMAGLATPENLGQVCARQGLYAKVPRRMIDSFCPMPETREDRRAQLVAVARYGRYVYQPYLVVGDVPWLPDRGTARARALVGVVGICFFGAALAVATPAYRPWVGAAVVVLVYSAAVTAVGQVTLPRYVAATSPFLLLISVLAGLSAVERHRGWRRPSSAAGGVAADRERAGASRRTW
jgi:hypothetical protein